VIIFGGPNYGLSDEEINEFWSNHSNYIDFNVILEGELAFYTLLKSLLVNGFDIDKVKLLHNELVNLHYIHTNGKIIKTNVAERVDIDNLPSPYLDTDLLDKFFDGKLIPLTHSTRGCPFKCTFCSEGAEYYNKVKQRQNRIKEEYRYIALKSVEVGIYDLMLSDANYGMFKDDAYRAEQLAMVQSELGYPKNVYVSTGKNQKERVLGVVKKLRGAVQLSASLQSTDVEVLDNIERSNISISTLADAAKEASQNKIASYSELILGLPGETLATHIQSIVDVANAGFTNIRIYQLILLPQTELNTSSSRQNYDLETRFRPMPRSFGAYNVGESVKRIIEYEEIVISTRTLPKEDYSTARKCGLMVELTHNGWIFRELQMLFSLKQVTWGEFLRFLFEKVKKELLPLELTVFFNEFIHTMDRKLFASKKELLAHVDAVNQELVLESLTANELAQAKARILINHFEALNAFVYESASEFLNVHCVEISHELIASLKKISMALKSNIFNDAPPEDIALNLNASDSEVFLKCLNNYMFEHSSENQSLNSITVIRDDTARDEISRLTQFYGNDAAGRERVVMRFPILSKFFSRIRIGHQVETD
jgi:radical SAM superfamily enzyme YgiQ (UPF0313 family)